MQIREGIFSGGWDAARRKVADSSLAATRFKFYLGGITWSPGQLEEEMKSGAWIPVSLPRAHCSLPPFFLLIMTHTERTGHPVGCNLATRNIASPMAIWLAILVLKRHASTAIMSQSS
eukprot:scaffold4665_cov33-Tisochrysis_lutea.AAC.1